MEEEACWERIRRGDRLWRMTLHRAEGVSREGVGFRKSKHGCFSGQGLP